ncbi:MAG TPA: hypothetical protein VKE72_09160, partial [Methylocella sp.]|nr:hypothetical protein [Methylocella sp.]
MKMLYCANILAAFCLTALSPSALLSETLQVRPDVVRPSIHALSGPLRDIKAAPPVYGPPRVTQRLWAKPPKITPYQRDPVLQTFRGAPASATLGFPFYGICGASGCGVSQFDGAGSGLLALPPDTNGAVGISQFVQW